MQDNKPDNDYLCVCGHSASSHRTYGCVGWSLDSAKKNERRYCACKAFEEAKTPKAVKAARY